MDAWFAVGLGFLCTLLLTPLIGRAAWAIGAVSRPDGVRRLHSRATPMWGGVGVCIALLAGMAASLAGCASGPWYCGASGLLAGLALSTGLLCLLGMIDDRFPLSAYAKISGQALATLPVILLGGSLSRLTLLGVGVNLGPWGAVWSVGWLLLGINALNLLDGSDGLASILGVVISLAIAALASLRGNPEVVVVALSLAGALAGFLVYNRPPARIYLGDCGSTVIGLVLATLALWISRSDSATGDFTVMGLLMFVPLLDTALAILRRKLKGQAVFSGDRGHMHHQLQDRGFGPWQIMGFLGGYSLFTAAALGLGLLLNCEAAAWACVAGTTLLAAAGGLVARQECSLLLARLVRGVTPRPAARLAHENRGVPPSVEPVALTSPLRRRMLPLQPPHSGVLARAAYRD